MMKGFHLSAARRDLIAVVLLAALALLAFPLLSSLAASGTLEATPTALTTPLPGTPTEALPARVYLLPFRQVFAVGQPQPSPVLPFLLYENGTDVFQAIGRQGNYIHLQTTDGSTAFWTSADNTTTTPPTAASYDFSIRGKTAQLTGAGFACLHVDNAVPPLSACQSSSIFVTATLTARITAGPVSLYLAEINGRNYYLSLDAIQSIS